MMLSFVYSRKSTISLRSVEPNHANELELELEATAEPDKPREDSPLSPSSAEHDAPSNPHSEVSAGSRSEKPATSAAVEDESALGSGTGPPESSAPGAEGSAAGTWSLRTTRDAPLVVGDTRNAGVFEHAMGASIDRLRKKPDGLASALDASDAAAGYFRGTSLRYAVEKGAQSSDAPVEGVAIFEITVGPHTPAKVRLLDGSNDPRGWSRIVGAIEETARQKAVRFPRDGSGLRVVVRVEAAERLPDGRKPADMHIHTSSEGLAIVDAPPGQSKLRLPSATLHLPGKVCSLDLTLGVGPPISGGCNPDAIGAKPSRRVDTRILSEERVNMGEAPDASSG